MKTFEVLHTGPGEPVRLKATDSGRVLAVISADEARQLWINLGAALGLGTASLTVKNVQGASSLKVLAKRLRKSAEQVKKSARR